MATTDSNGIVFLEDTDLVSPLQTTINVLQAATSNALTSFKTADTSWASWSPTLTNITVGNGTLTAYSRTFGSGLVYLELYLTGGTTTSITGTVSISNLPYTARSTNSLPLNLHGVMRDGSGAYVPVQGAPNNSTSFRLTTSSGTVNATVPFTFGDGDVMYLGGYYARA